MTGSHGMDEFMYTTDITTAVERYLKEKLPHRPPDTTTPHSRRQNPEAIDWSYCADIIMRLDKLRLLLFEVKIINPKTLYMRAYDEPQHNFLKALEGAGGSVKYCYNKRAHYTGLHEEAVLMGSNTSLPELLRMNEKKLTSINGHVDLKTVIDGALATSGGAGNNEILGALSDAGAARHLYQLNTKLLLFIYNPQSALEIKCLPMEKIVELSEYLEEGLSLAPTEFSFETASVAKMQEHFEERLKIFYETRQRFVAKKRLKDVGIALQDHILRTPPPPDFGTSGGPVMGGR